MSSFYAFDQDNPLVYEMFDKFTREIIGRGFEHYSADAILHVVRFHTNVHGHDGSGFKINNNYSADYARKWMKDNPEYEGFFRTRERRSHSNT